MRANRALLQAILEPLRTLAALQPRARLRTSGYGAAMAARGECDQRERQQHRAGDGRAAQRRHGAAKERAEDSSRETVAVAEVVVVTVDWVAMIAGGRGEVSCMRAR